MPKLSDDALVTVADVKAYLDVEDGGKPNNVWIQRAINGTSAVIVEKTHSWGGAADQEDPDAAEIRVFEHDGGPLLTIDPCRVPSLVRVTATPKDADSWETLDDGDWIAEPQRLDIKQRLRFMRELPTRMSGWSALSRSAAGFPPTRWPGGIDPETLHSSIEVTAVWGYAAIPDHVKLACLLWISALYRRDVQFLTDSIPEGARVAGGIPKDVMEIIEGEQDDVGAVSAV